MSDDAPMLAGIQRLLLTRRTAALGTLTNQGLPFVSLVPFAIAPELQSIVIHISELAAHTRYLMQRPNASLLINQGEQDGEPVHELPRATLQTRASQLIRGDQNWDLARQAYMARFPDAEFMTSFQDFHFFSLAIVRVRHVAGFGAAHSVEPEKIRQLLKSHPWHAADEH